MIVHAVAHALQVLKEPCSSPEPEAASHCLQIGVTGPVEFQIPKRKMKQWGRWGRWLLYRPLASRPPVRKADLPTNLALEGIPKVFLKKKKKNSQSALQP